MANSTNNIEKIGSRSKRAGNTVNRGGIKPDSDSGKRRNKGRQRRRDWDRGPGDKWPIDAKPS